MPGQLLQEHRLFPLRQQIPAKQVDIVFTHDTHSHLNTFTTVVDDAEKEVGGFARINTLIQEQKAKNLTRW